MLEAILKKKFKQKRLAGFYILKSPFFIDSPDQFLETWITKLLSSFIEHHREIPEGSLSERIKQGHSDILYVRKNEQKAGYIWNKQENDFREFLKFLYFKPLELPHKFIVITQAHLIPKDISNKLLKSLEDIPKQTTLFFLIPGQKTLLPTILSRALEITIPLPQHLKEESERNTNLDFYPSRDIETWFEQHITWEKKNDENLEATSLRLPYELKEPLFHFFKKNTGENNIIEILKCNTSYQESFTLCYLHWETRHLSHFKDKERALEELKWGLKSANYRNPLSERLFSLLWAFKGASQA
jgi:hypothetical protein